MCHLRVHNFPINQVGADDEEDNFLFRSHFARQAMHGRTLCRYWRRRWRRKEDGFVFLLQARDHSLHFVRGQKQSLCLCIPWQARPPAESACKLATVKSFRSRCSKAACARGALHDTLVGCWWLWCDITTIIIIIVMRKGHFARKFTPKTMSRTC